MDTKVLTAHVPLPLAQKIDTLGNWQPLARTATMKLKWSNEAVADVARLHDFLVKVNPTAAARSTQTFTDFGLRWAAAAWRAVVNVK